MKLCWLYRIAISWSMDSQTPVRSWVRHHLLTCQECHDFQEAEVRVTMALRTEANAQLLPTPPFLRAKITVALDRETSGIKRPIQTFRWVRTTLIPALGAFAIASYLVWKSDDVRIVAPESSSAEVNVLPGEVLSQPTPAQLLAWAEQLDQPLQKELDSVVSDARTVLKSLTETFLPEGLLDNRQL